MRDAIKEVTPMKQRLDIRMIGVSSIVSLLNVFMKTITARPKPIGIDERKDLFMCSIIFSPNQKVDALSDMPR